MSIIAGAVALMVSSIIFSSILQGLWAYTANQTPMMRGAFAPAEPSGPITKGEMMQRQAEIEQFQVSRRSLDEMERAERRSTGGPSPEATAYLNTMRGVLSAAERQGEADWQMRIERQKLR
ncbi:MAG: hypothetical protein NT029_05255 [Armatimonadetes bacterium]|nr:hypothetical protein [Armatimonadota bacterium]